MRRDMVMGAPTLLGPATGMDTAMGRVAQWRRGLMDMAAMVGRVPACRRMELVPAWVRMVPGQECRVTVAVQECRPIVLGLAARVTEHDPAEAWARAAAAVAHTADK